MLNRIVELKSSYIVFPIMCMILLNPLFAQVEKDIEEADKYYKSGIYIKALDKYTAAVKKESENDHAKLRAALCVMKLPMDQTIAIEFLKKISDKEKLSDFDYYFAKAHFFAGDDQKAEMLLNSYTDNPKHKLKKEAKKLNDQIFFRKDEKNTLYNVTFTNVEELNTEFPDYQPIVSVDGNFLAFSSRRRGVTGNKIEFDGYYTADIFTTKKTTGKWTPPSKLSSTINTPHDEIVVGMTNDAATLYFYFDNVKNNGEIYETTRSKTGKFSKKMLVKGLDQKGLESAACISADGNTLIFSSERKKGVGGKDIYTAKKLDDGTWGDINNMGPIINSPMDEDNPFISADGMTLYFSSNKADGIGGFDLYMSRYNEKELEWEIPINMGAPLNTPFNEFNISLLPGEKEGYISRWRQDSKGFQDIYHIKLSDPSEKQETAVAKVEHRINESILKMRLFEKNSNKKVSTATISIIDQKTSKIIDAISSYNDENKYLSKLMAGKYFIEINAEGYLPVKVPFFVYGGEKFKTFRNKKFLLEKAQ